MNMALRPFSLLLLLLVMIPAMSQLMSQLITTRDGSYVEYTKMRCDQPTWFCFQFGDPNGYKLERFIGKEAYKPMMWGGIALDTSIPNEWKVYYDWWFGENYPIAPEGCSSTIATKTNARKEVIPCKSITNTGIPFDRNGIKIVPLHFDSKWFVIDYKLEVNPGSFVADKFKLFADPEINLEFFLTHNNAKKDPWHLITPYFKPPYECNIYKTGEKPGDSATEASKSVSTFSCSSGKNIFLQGANAYQPTVYCGGEGWFGMDKEMILKRSHFEKETPYCMEDVMFEDCAKNKCFVFGDSLKQAQPANKLVKVNNPAEIKDKLGAYLVFESDKKWQLNVAYNNKDADMTSISIGPMNFKTNKLDENIVVMKIVRDSPKLLSGFKGFIYTIEAKGAENEKDLMKLFKFYEGVENKIKLDFNGKLFEAEGVANFGKYERTSMVTFAGPNAVIRGAPDVHNLFNCPGNQRIFLDNQPTGVNEIRFTKTGWLKRDGTPIAQINNVVAGVYCFTVCNDASITSMGDPKPIKTATSTATKLEYGCAGESVKVNSKVYSSVTCENNQWTGDGEAIVVSAAFTFNAECYGALNLKSTCSAQETSLGCAEAIVSKGVLTCKPGYALMISYRATDPDKIYTSLKLVNNHWFEDQTDLGVAEAAHRAVCYSKCSKNNVEVDTASADSEVAVYTPNPDKNTGELKCAGTNNLLVVTLEGNEKPYGTLTCNEDGWKEGATVVSKVFNTAKSEKQLKVKARCFKACDEGRLDKTCAAADTNFDCADPAYATLKLTCPPSHVLFVNDKLADKSLVCSSKGWKKDGEANLFVDNNAIDLSKKIVARCYSKCGKKFVTGSAPFSSKKIACDGTKMISYIVDADPAKDTLHDMICDQDGWKFGKDAITFAPGTARTIKAECKPSCSDKIVKDGCTKEDNTVIPFCEKAKFENDEWSCKPSHVLWAVDKGVASPDPIKCEKLQLKSDKLAIARESPTAEIQISCISICDEEFFPSVSNTMQKTHDNSGGFTLKCKSDLHHLAISYAQPTRTSSYYSEFKCTTDKVGRDSITTDHLGESSKITCRNKCDDRIKADSCGADDKDCVKPTLDAATNKLTCDDAHVLRIKNDASTPAKYVFGNALECKKDGFYESAEKLLSFADNPEDDVKLQFGIACISTCDSELALVDNKEIKDSSNPDRTGDVVKCHSRTSIATLAKDQILHITYGEATMRVFEPATCVKDSGWTGDNAKEKPTGPVDTNIVKFAGKKAMLETKCVEVCDGITMVKDMKDVADAKDENGNPLCPGGLCGQINRQTAKELKCDANYRLFLNGNNNDGSTVAAADTMTCSNVGWMEGTATVVNFKDPAVDITKPVEAVCKHKCHPHFISYDLTKCPKDSTDCSEPIYDPATTTLKCADPTEVLVLEHNSKVMESLNAPEAKCDVSGWSVNGQTLFDMSAAGYLNFQIKARCEQLCVYNLDKAALNVEVSNGIVFDRELKTLTCSDTTQMLALGDAGVYSDLTCTGKGWKMDSKFDVSATEGTYKINFAPITAPEDDAATKTQREERTKKFTCVPNDCLRSFYCKGNDFSKKETQEDCINPDITKIKYEMSCTSPSKLTKTDNQGLSYDSLRCYDGVWKVNKADANAIVGKLEAGAIDKPVPERASFDVMCNADACTGCTGQELHNISSTTDANIGLIPFTPGTFKTCSQFKCGTGKHYIVEDNKKKYTYYANDGSNSIKCTSTKEQAGAKSYIAPDLKSTVEQGAHIGCVSQIPCNEHRPINTNCGSTEGCDATFNQLLKDGSRQLNNGPPQPIQCEGLMYIRWNSDTSGWRALNKLQCTAKGEWEAIIRLETNITMTLPETRKLNENDADEKKTIPHVICSKSNPNPNAETPTNDRKTASCSFCSFPTVNDCEGCTKPDGQATTTNDGDGKCLMTIVNGRFKFNGNEEIDKSAALVCKEINGEWVWQTPDGKKVETLAVIMNEMDNISTGAIAGIIIGVILVLGLIVFGMVYVAIKKRKDMERQEKLKNKGLEQKQDSIIDAATIVDDTKTLVI